MKKMNNPVAITKVKSSIADSVKKAIDAVGGMDSVVNEGDKVYIKPNFVGPRDSSHGVTTDLEIVRVVAEEIRRCGGIPFLFETPAVDFDKNSVYEYLGIYDFAKKNKISLVDGFEDLIKITIHGSRAFKSLKIPNILHDAKIVNLPKLKTHVLAKMTCGMKNLIGLLPDSEKIRAHVFGLHASIADISKVFRPVLTIVDAVTCMEGDGPTYGDKIDLGLIISGKDPLSVDRVCSQIIGLPWQKVKYLCFDDDQKGNNEIPLIGDALSEVKVPFAVPQKSVLFHAGAWMIYALDVVFSKISTKSLVQVLYSTGYIGTIPKMIKKKCSQCRDCLEACPVENTISVDAYKIDYKNCIRCLDCVQACPEDAITVKGISHPKK